MTKDHPLKKYLDAWGIPAAEFANTIGCTKARVYQILDGDTLSMAMAAKIVQATNGAVSFEAFSKYNCKG